MADNRKPRDPMAGVPERVKRYTANCEGCGKPILWLTRPRVQKEGEVAGETLAPVDPRAVVFFTWAGAEGKLGGLTGKEFLERLDFIQLKPDAAGVVKKVTAEQLLGIFVTHFATCPQVKQFAAARAPARE